MRFTVYRFDKVVSTNTLLKEGNYPIGSVAVAQSQTGGRGRGEKNFNSPPFGLYFSIVLPAGSVSENLFKPIEAAVIVCNALSEYTACEIKWPNDILCGNKKVCGILCESYKDRLVVGVGINVNTPSEYFLSSGLPHATSLYEQTGVRHNIESLLSKMLKSFAKKHNKFEVMSRYKEKCQTLGKEITIIQGDNSYSAFAADLTDSGELIVITEGKRKTINSGEVSIRGSERLQ